MTQTCVTRVYDRIAPVYDIWNAPMEWLGLHAQRRRILEKAGGSVSKRESAPDAKAGREVELREADVAALPCADDMFDTTTASCLFCSVADPAAGLRELARVTRPHGRILLLEHVRPTDRIAGAVAGAISPLTARLFGPALNRRTEEQARAVGLDLIEVRRNRIWPEIVARPPTTPTSEVQP